MIAVELFLETDLRKSHKGLTEILRKKRIELTGTQAAIFINSPKTGIKIISANTVLSYAKFPRGIDYNSFNVFMEAYMGKGSQMPFSKSVRDDIAKALGLKLATKYQRLKPSYGMRAA